MMHNPDLFPHVAVDPLDAPLLDPPLEDAPLLDPLLGDAPLGDASLEELPDYEDSGDSGGGYPGRGGVPWWRLSPDVVREEEEEVEEEDWDWDDGDSGYDSLSEEEEEEGEEEDGEEREEDDQRFPPEEFWVGWRAPPAQAVEPVGLPQIPAPQQRAESPPPALRAQRISEDVLQLPALGQLSPAGPSASSAPDFLPLVGTKRSREEDDDDTEVRSTRPRLSSFEDHPDDPSPSTSAGTSCSFTRYYHVHDLFQDPESDDD